jgi:hypothetical protein
VRVGQFEIVRNWGYNGRLPSGQAALEANGPL